MDINNEVEKQEELVFSERIRKVRKAIDKSLPDKKLNKDRRLIYVHIYGVAQTAAILAKKRGLNVELSIIAGMLHDIYTLVYLDPKKHAHKGAKMAMKILVDIDMFSPVEIAIIYTAIYNHSDKDVVNGVYDELLKDADVLQHVMFDPLTPVFDKDVKRYNSLIDELGFKENHVPCGQTSSQVEELAKAINEADEELKVEESLENIEGDIEAAVVAGDTAGTGAAADYVAAGTVAALSEGVVPQETQTADNQAALAKAGAAAADVIILGTALENVAESGKQAEAEGINTVLSDEEANDMLEAVTANITVSAASIAGMSNSEAAMTYSRNPKQFEAVIDEINQYIEKINKVNSSIDEQNKIKNGEDDAIKPIVSLDYPVPENYWTDTFYFCKLTPELTQLDYEAVMEAREEIRRIYNITDPEEWPNDSLTIEEDREDLVDHEREFDNRQAFAYSVFNLARKKCFGCFYISPCSKPDYDVFVTLWGLNEAITSKLYKDVKKFVYDKFEFRNPAYPAFEIPLDEWEESVNPGVW